MFIDDIVGTRRLEIKPIDFSFNFETSCGFATVFSPTEMPKKEFFNLFSPSTKSRISAYSNEKRIFESSWARVVIYLVANKLASLIKEKAEVIENPPLSPTIKVGKLTFFTSISHSDRNIAVMFSKHKCALDIEKVRVVRPNRANFVSLINPKLKNSIFSNNEISFLAFWGAYETAIKIKERFVTSTSSILSDSSRLDFYCYKNFIVSIRHQSKLPTYFFPFELLNSSL